MEYNNTKLNAGREFFNEKGGNMANQEHFDILKRGV